MVVDKTDIRLTKSGREAIDCKPIMQIPLESISEI